MTHLGFLYIISVDATKIDCVAKFVNDSLAKFANCILKKYELRGQPCIYLKACENIVDGEKLRSYGDTDLPWPVYVRNLY